MIPVTVPICAVMTLGRNILYCCRRDVFQPPSLSPLGQRLAILFAFWCSRKVAFWLLSRCCDSWCIFLFFTHDDAMQVIPLASLITPNQFEAELLTDSKYEYLHDPWHRSSYTLPFLLAFALESRLRVAWLQISPEQAFWCRHSRFDRGRGVVEACCEVRIGKEKSGVREVFLSLFITCTPFLQNRDRGWRPASDWSPSCVRPLQGISFSWHRSLQNCQWLTHRAN